MDQLVVCMEIVYKQINGILNVVYQVQTNVPNYMVSVVVETGMDQHVVPTVIVYMLMIGILNA